MRDVLIASTSYTPATGKGLDFNRTIALSIKANFNSELPNYFFKAYARSSPR